MVLWLQKSKQWKAWQNWEKVTRTFKHCVSDVIYERPLCRHVPVCCHACVEIDKDEEFCIETTFRQCVLNQSRNGTNVARAVSRLEWSPNLVQDGFELCNGNKVTRSQVRKVDLDLSFVEPGSNLSCCSDVLESIQFSIKISISRKGYKVMKVLIGFGNTEPMGDFVFGCKDQHNKTNDTWQSRWGVVTVSPNFTWVGSLKIGQKVSRLIWISSCPMRVMRPQENGNPVHRRLQLTYLCFMGLQD